MALLFREHTASVGPSSSARPRRAGMVTPNTFADGPRPLAGSLRGGLEGMGAKTQDLPLMTKEARLDRDQEHL